MGHGGLRPGVNGLWVDSGLLDVAGLGCGPLRGCFLAFLQQTLHPDCVQVMSVLSGIDEWHFDIFKLDEVSEGRPLSMLSFAIMMKAGLIPGR